MAPDACDSEVSRVRAEAVLAEFAENMLGVISSMEEGQVCTSYPFLTLVAIGPLLNELRLFCSELVL